MPWHRSGEGLNRPVNIETTKAYRGINVVSLWAAAQSSGFSTGTWGTCRQWQNNDCQVRKGEKSSLVLFYRDFDMEARNDDTGDTEHSTRLMARELGLQRRSSGWLRGGRFARAKGPRAGQRGR
jgi:antirestriction protein ArdC